MNISYQKKLNNIIERLEKLIYDKDVILKGETCQFKKEMILTEIMIYSKKMKLAYSYLEDVSRTLSMDILDNIEDIKIFISIEIGDNKKAL